MSQAIRKALDDAIDAAIVAREEASKKTVGHPFNINQSWSTYYEKDYHLAQLVILVENMERDGLIPPGKHKPSEAMPM